MAYDRDDRSDERAGRGSYNGGRGYGGDAGGRDYGRQPQGYDYDDRGFLDRAGDEVRSWFGDEDAERRRRMDERFDDRAHGASPDRAPYGQREFGRGADDGREGYGSRSYTQGRGGYGAEGSGRMGGAGQGGSGSFGSGGHDRGGSGGGWASSGRGGGGSQPSRDDDRYRYGLGSSANYGAGDRAQDQGGWRDRGQDHEPSYRSWRDRQMESFDRDYEDYRRENQSRFDSEFSAWRGKRETQRGHLRSVQEHQEVVGSDGQHIGTVDHVQGDQIKLAKNDRDAGGQHHFIPCSWIESVDDKVTVSKTASEARQHWTDEARHSGSAMFGAPASQARTQSGETGQTGGGAQRSGANATAPSASGGSTGNTGLTGTNTAATGGETGGN